MTNGTRHDPCIPRHWAMGCPAWVINRIRPNTDVASISSVLHLVWPLAQSLSSMVVPTRSQNSSWHSLWDLRGTQAPQLRQSNNTLGGSWEETFCPDRTYLQIFTNTLCALASQPQFYRRRTSLRYSRLVASISRLTLPSFTVTLVPCKVAKKTVPGTYVFKMVETAPGFLDQAGISIPNTMVKVGVDAMITIPVLNETYTCHSVASGSVIGVLEPFVLASISILVEPQGENSWVNLLVLNG